MDFGPRTDRAIAALSKMADLWQARLDSGWSPPPGSQFPWVQVRLSLVALLPGMRSAREWAQRATVDTEHLGAVADRTVAMILAGNTPLLAWSPLCACLLAGVRSVRVKLSRDERVWTRLFAESLREVDGELAGTIRLFESPGEDERTYALLQDADAVVAYGSDAAIRALQVRTPSGVPFFGYGHALSMAIVRGDDGDCDQTAASLARDILLFDQQGCLSPHLILTAGSGHSAAALAEALAAVLPQTAGRMETAPVTGERVAADIREARDMALFSGYRILGDAALQWTVAYTDRPGEFPAPVGHRFIAVMPLEHSERGDPLRQLLRPVRGIVSCAAVAGELPPECETALREAGVTRICKPGEMQTPPLDWQNGGRDLLTELVRIRRS